MNDLKAALARYQLWVSLGWNDVLGRYRRSVLGPFWITISMGVTISAMGPLYGSLFGAGSENFIMHLALGMIFWAFLSSSINDSCGIFNDSATIIKQSDLPLYIYILRVFYRQLSILLHNCIIIPFIIYITHSSVNWNLILFLPALAVTSVTLISVGMILGVFCTRYRDMGPVVQSIITLCFFVTPIIWSPEQLPQGRREFVDYNIFYYYLELLRKPLMGAAPETYIWVVAGATSVIMLILSGLILSKNRSKIVYWL
ncbi:O-antigen export system, permease protein [Erwinia sp. Ejp617]|nr:ABC transporter permease [Erwinia sp. Ejp617]ADP10990.1 O-antigen export system, permease protein [Erwinia sp. Ejp617]